MEVTANLLPRPWLLAGWGLLIGVPAAALSMAAATLVMSGVLLATGIVEPGYLWRDYLQS